MLKLSRTRGDSFRDGLTGDPVKETQQICRVTGRQRAEAAMKQRRQKRGERAHKKHIKTARQTQTKKDV